ncbi:MAG TPA: hypothetical protein VFS44_03590 [Gemmatimonadaceae bacterium]|nr:hypothetical protein [Gemmatimonadaceae bacterium]
MADRREKGVAAPERSAAPAGRKRSKGAASGVATRSTSVRGAAKMVARAGRKSAPASKRATGARRTGTASGNGTKAGARNGAKQGVRKRQRSGATTRASKGKASNAGNGAKGATAPTQLMRIRALDPQATCGQGTTVLQLFRVDDLPFGDYTTHLVFFDRHGWYCEHGRDCPAVAAVRRHEKHVTLTR